MSQTRSILASCALALVVLQGCVANRLYHPEGVVQEDDPYALAFVEFDDQGELWSPPQLSRALELIGRHREHAGGALVFVFVHGWNHNASPREERPGGNVFGFRGILSDVVAAEGQRAERTGELARPVVGVYLGWRGKTVRTPLLLPFSFFNRRGAADRIAGLAATETVYRLTAAAKENPESKVVLIGHSFGGLILERAVTQAMLGAVLDPELRGDRFPADAVVLLNPASQALHAKQFIETLSRDRIKLYRTDASGRRFERPLIVSVTSSGDWATRLLFPVGLGFKGLLENFRTYGADSCTPIGRQKVFYRRTAGHTGVLLSHVITSESPGSEDDPADRFGAVANRFDPATRQREFAFRGEHAVFAITRRPRALNVSPYWILKAPKELLPDHSRIFGSDTLRLIGAILAITGALERDSQTILVRERGLRPIELVPRPDGVVIALDQDRHVYLIEGDGPPRSPGCIPQAVDAVDRVALAFDPSGGHAVISRPLDAGPAPRYRTDLLAIRMTESGPVIARSVRLRGDRQYLSGAFDFDGRRLFLASAAPGEIWQLSLDRPREAPQRLVTVAQCGPINLLAFDIAHHRLLAADGQTGVLFGIDPGEGPTDTVGAVDLGTSRHRMLADGLGWPVSLAADPATGTVYAVDSKAGQLWRIRCAGRDDACQEPEPVPLRDTLGHPSYVAVDPSGDVWVAGLDDRRIVALDSSGEIVRTIEEGAR